MDARYLIKEYIYRCDKMEKLKDKKFDMLIIRSDKDIFFNVYAEIENYMMKSGNSAIMFGESVGRAIASLIHIGMSSQEAEKLVYNILFQCFHAGVYFQIKNHGSAKIEKSSREDQERVYKEYHEGKKELMFG